MLTSRLLPLAFIPFLAAAGLNAAPEAQALFDGRSLARWEGDATVWSVEDGAITGTIADGQSLERNAFLFWEGEVHDFELTLEFRISGHPSANSGIQFRSQRLPDGDAAGLQADLDMGAEWLGRIYDEHGRALLVERGTRVSIAPDGRRWVDTFAELEGFKTLFKPDRWNTYRITARASHVEVWVNGELCSVLDDHQLGEAEFSGRLALQLHSGPGPVKLQFRNINLVSLGKTEQPTTAASRAPEPREEPDRLVEGEPGDRRFHAGPVLWHLQPNPAAERANGRNLDANRVIRDTKVMQGFEFDLVAAEPEIHQPIAFAIDDRGRLWVVEAYGYPVRQPEGKGQDRILIFEDADGDGTFETRKLFTEGLNLVSGIELGFGGVWIGAAPELLFIPDRDGDDRPDGPPEVLLDGWGYQDTHETLNSFTWGPDGWLYGNQGVFVQSNVGRPGTPESERTRLRAGVWRYHPVRHEFEVFSHGGSNQWGIDFNSKGHLFITHCRSFHGGGGTTFAIRNGHYWNQTNSDYPAFISNRAPDFAPDMKNLMPASARYDSGEGGAGKPGTTAVYGGHSHVGTMIYLGDNWPEIYRDHLFTHNLHGRQINHQHNVRRGSGYETFHAGYDMLFSPDLSYLPVDLQYGPDGAVYIIDWCDVQHCHHPLPEAWNRTNGRIYRMSWTDGYKPRSVNLGRMNDLELAELHTHRSEWFVRTARRLLQERAAQRALEQPAVERLRALMGDADVVQRLRALWTLHVANQLSRADLEDALRDRAEEVRAWAITLGTDQPGKLVLPEHLLVQRAQEEPSSLARLAIASAMPLVSDEACWAIATHLSKWAVDASDRFLPRMVWFGLARVARSDPAQALSIAASSRLPTLADSIRWYLAGTEEGRERLVAEIATAPGEVAARQLKLFEFSLEAETSLREPKAWRRVVTRFQDNGDQNLRPTVEELSAIFGDRDVLRRMRERLADANAPVDERNTALKLLARVGDREAMPIYVSLLDHPEFRSAVLPLLDRSDEATVGEALVERVEAFSDADRATALMTLASRPRFAKLLLAAVEDGEVDKRHLNAFHIRQMRNLRDEAIDTQLDRVWGTAGESSGQAKETVARFKKTFTEAPLWAFSVDNGRKRYQQLCASCHALDGVGGGLGPDLNGSWRNGVDYFLENIVDPNAVVGIDYQLNVITRKDGSVVSGMVERETESAFVVRTMTETITVPRDSVASRDVLEQSLMPPGLLEPLTEPQLLELLRYLTYQRKEQ